MINRTSPNALDRRTRIGLFLGMLAVLLLFIVSGIVSYHNIRTFNEDVFWVTHTHEVLSALSDISFSMKDAETNQRGYLLTGNQQYLALHKGAVERVEERVDDLVRLTVDNLNQQARIPALKSRIQARWALLDQNIEIRREHGFETAPLELLIDRGKIAMEAIQDRIGEMRQEEDVLLKKRTDEMDSAYRIAVGSGVITVVVGIGLTVVVGYLIRKAAINRQRQDWLLSGQIGLNRSTAGDQKLEQLGANVLTYLAEYLDASVGAFFVMDGGSFRRAAAYGVPNDTDTPERIESGNGLLWQAARDNRTFLINEVPDGYLSIGSSFGKGKPRQLLIVPVTSDGVVNGVIELGFIQSSEDSTTEFLTRVSEPIGVTVRAAAYRAHLQNLLNETQQQAEELQAQSEELRVSNEELEEQGRALKESQTRLEQQQGELEQTNSQLEEQAQILEAQRDDVNQAKEALELQARKLERASQYKSDFLANMSHELRTPLNSSLILAKLLAENPQGNLSAEQVQYAQTIEGAGNDLLALINDILDLSKIEAGYMEVRPEQITLTQLVSDLTRYFRPIAEQRGLAFRTQVMPACPETLESDRQRVEQVLKNLLSNAMKFTEKGEVELSVSRTSDGRISFAVIDTGIGIEEGQQQVVFEAFRQADGTTSRKYGGTGLGLSISRELARLLGGEIGLTSEPGRGSTFTLILPEIYDPVAATSRATVSKKDSIASQATGELSSRNAAVERTAPQTNTKSSARSRPRVRDDRESLTGNRLLILVVEDDEKFARILYDLAHELDFQCLVAPTAEEGITVASQYLPSAVILDIGLPDHSGLTVLDRLKHDRRTRHIPVHVVSANDYAETALSLGAVGHILKPAQREKLLETLKSFETRLAQRMRRVLVVEDDAVQRDSLQRLLGSHDVETVGAGSAAECLQLLKGATFDCMVLDLSLPDASGYSLLETLSREDSYAFPPVIVYTGRDLSMDEEQRLRRYSKSIIIKGAKSPERLLDEVTLFLHQVVTELPAEQQRMLEKARSRDAAIEGRRILIVEDDVRSIFALTSILESRGATVQIARNGYEALATIEKAYNDPAQMIDLVLMDVMMPEMDGITATREIRKRPEWKKLPVLMLTAKAMKDDQEHCLAAGANDYMAKPLDIEKLLSLVRVWMPR